MSFSCYWKCLFRQPAFPVGLTNDATWNRIVIVGVDFQIVALCPYRSLAADEQSESRLVRRSPISGYAKLHDRISNDRSRDELQGAVCTSAISPHTPTWTACLGRQSEQDEGDDCEKTLHGSPTFPCKRMGDRRTQSRTHTNRLMTSPRTS
jgi:hypothetical protein